jgi:DNA primase
VIWDLETRGRAVDTPERRAAVEKGLLERARGIADKQVQEYYLRDFRRRLRDAFADFSPVAGARRRAFGATGPDSRRRLASDPLIGTEDGRADARERVLVATVLNHPDLLDDVAEEFAAVEIGSHELNSLRQAIVEAAAMGEAPDSEALAKSLNARGFGRLVESLVGSRAHVLDWFARPGAARDDALTGFRHALDLHIRVSGGTAELEACESAFAEDPSEENWARLQAVRQQLLEKSAHEDLVTDFGNGSKDNENA